MTKRRTYAMLAAAVLVVTACGDGEGAGTGGGGDSGTGGTGGDASPSPPGNGSGDQAGDGTHALTEVYAALEGLEGEARTDALAELAQSEACPGFMLYTSVNFDTSLQLVNDFAQEYGIETGLYRAGNELYQRILQEVDAGHQGADVVSTPGDYMLIMDNEGLFAPLESPVKDDIVDAGTFDNWASLQITLYVTAWNSNNISAADLSPNFEEVLQSVSGAGVMGMLDSNVDYFATIVTHYLMGELGMSEDEAVGVFRTAFENGAQSTSGNTVTAQLLAAGEVNIVPGLSQFQVDRLAGEGAPLAWEDPEPVLPIVASPDGVAVMNDTDCPARSLLLAEWLLSHEGGGRIIAEVGRLSANTRVTGEAQDVLTRYPLLPLDLTLMNEDRAKWDGLWEEILRLQGQ